MKTKLAAALVALSASGFATAGTIEVYSNNFDSSATVAAGVNAILTGSTNSYIGTATGTYTSTDGKTWSGNYFNSYGAAATLTLTNLPTHTGINIDMLLGFLNSWDGGTGTNGTTGDYLNIYIDGNTTPLLNMTTYHLNHPHYDPSTNNFDFDGGTQLVNDGEIDGYTFISDDLADMATASALTFNHTASTLTMGIAPTGRGWQGWPDEGWGMDSLSVTLTGTANIPEPTTLALLGIGFAGLGAARRRKAA